MTVDVDRAEALLSALRAAVAPLSGPALSAQFGVSTRSVRQYVHTLNERAGEDLVTTTRAGYALDRNAYARFRARRAAVPRRQDTPPQRLYLLSRRLVMQPGGVTVGELAETLSVSLDTVESDLARARELFRGFGLVLRREHEVLTVRGGEREKRQLVRQLLLNSASGVTTAMMRAFAQEYPRFDLRALRQRLRSAWAGAGIEVNEYAVTDILVHLTIAADRVRQGHTVEDPDAPAASEDEVADVGTASPIMAELCAAVRETLGVDLPPAEQHYLRRVVSSRIRPRAVDAGHTVPEEIDSLVRQTLQAISGYYALDLGDAATTASLALHVQALIARARSGDRLRTSIGPSFKAMHPVIHELALFFASAIEERAGVTVDEGEIDFLAFHLGTRFQRQLDQGPLLTVALVVPRLRDTPEEIAGRLAASLAGIAVVDTVITELDHDWAEVSSDIIASVVELPSRVTAAPVVRISPFLTMRDVEAVRSVAGSERRRMLANKLRGDVLGLVDAGLFHHVSAPLTREEVLARMCGRMAEDGVVDPAFLADVVDRETRSSTAFGEHFAVPHSLYMDARHTAISVLISDRPIPWGSAGVRLVVLFAVSADQRHLFREVLDQLIAVLGDPERVLRLIARGETHASFVRTLDELLSD